MIRKTVKDFKGTTFIVEFHKNEFYIYSSVRKSISKFDNKDNLIAINAFLEDMVILNEVQA